MKGLALFTMNTPCYDPEHLLLTVCYSLTLAVWTLDCATSMSPKEHTESVRETRQSKQETMLISALPAQGLLKLKRENY